MSLFRPAVKEEAKLRLAIAGPSGSGKTYTALSVATHLANGSKIAVVDTEHGSASKYADLFTFDVLNLEPPFSPYRFVEAIEEAQKAGYGVIILDSVSHAWNGTGGVLEIVDQAAKKFKGNTYAGWAEGTPAQNALIEGIVGADLHVITTMRSKQDYILVEKGGKQVPQKVGMAPVQRDGFEYEFDVFLDMDIENNAIVSKTRCPALTGAVIPKPGADLANILNDWLQGAAPPTVDELAKMALDATNLADFAYAAFRLPGPGNVFESQQRLAAWYEYVSGGFNPAPERNALVLDVLDSYCSMIADGVKVKEAAEAARKQVQAVTEAEQIATVANDEEE